VLSLACVVLCNSCTCLKLENGMKDGLRGPYSHLHIVLHNEIRSTAFDVTLSKMTHFTLVIQVTENQALVVLQSQKVMLPVSNFEIDVNS